MKVLIVTFFIVLFDQLTKLYVKGIKIPFLGIDFAGMPYQSSKDVFGNFFKITFIENPGMAFGLQIGGKLFLSLFTIFATILLFVFLYKNRNESLLLRLSLAFILGGATGNLIDRVFYGKIYDYAPLFYGRVVDFLHFDFPNFTIFGKNIYSWPIFNIADIFVTLGFLLILFGYKKIFKDESDELNNENELLSQDEVLYESGYGSDVSEYDKNELLMHYDHKIPEIDSGLNSEENLNSENQKIENTELQNLTDNTEVTIKSTSENSPEKINEEQSAAEIKKDNSSKLNSENKKTD